MYKRQPQDLRPWCDALTRLLTMPAYYAGLSAKSREVAMRYVAALTIRPFESLLEGVLQAS